MKIEDFIQQLGINKEGYLENNVYTINLKDSNEYSDMYNLLDKSELVDLDISSIKLDDIINQVTYEGEDYTIALTADFDKDIYTITIR